MCKFNPKNKGRRIDPCITIPIMLLNWAIRKNAIKIVACCCGHGKYPKTIVCRKVGSGQVFELLSGLPIKRKKRFYRKDSEGYYYIPEVSQD